MSSHSLRVLIELIGIEGAYALCQEHGGERIYFGRGRKPMRLALDHRRLRILEQHYAGDVLEVPLAKKELAVHLVKHRGQTISEAAQTLRVSRATIRRWLEKTHQDANFSLFDEVLE